MAANKSNVLVRDYIEKMSGEIFEERYRDQLAELIEGHAGVYALYLNDTLYYVGLASDLMRRVGFHQKDRHAGRWNLFSVYLTSKSAHIKPLESLLLRVYMPEGNRVRGKLPGARGHMLRVLSGTQQGWFGRFPLKESFLRAWS